MSLETLPTELKRWILQAVPDVATLSALVQASPVYRESPLLILYFLISIAPEVSRHVSALARSFKVPTTPWYLAKRRYADCKILIDAVYLSIREECLTEVTVRDLADRKIDILTPCPLIEVCTHGNHAAHPNVKAAIKKCHHHSRTGARLRLTIHQCRVLMTVKAIILWSLSGTGDEAHAITCFRNSESGKEEVGRWTVPANTPHINLNIHRSQHAEIYGTAFARWHALAFESSTYPRLTAYSTAHQQRVGERKKRFVLNIQYYRS